MLNYQNITVPLSLLICLGIVYFLSIKKYNIITTKTKLILFYNSTKELCLNIINNVWKNIAHKYNNIEFILIDINDNKKYNHINFNEIPQIYLINQDLDLYYRFTDNMITQENLENFIISSMAFTNINF